MEVMPFKEKERESTHEPQNLSTYRNVFLKNIVGYRNYSLCPLMLFSLGLDAGTAGRRHQVQSRARDASSLL